MTVRFAGLWVAEGLAEVGSMVAEFQLECYSTRLPPRVHCSTEPCQVWGLESWTNPGWCLRCHSQFAQPQHPQQDSKLIPQPCYFP